MRKLDDTGDPVVVTGMAAPSKDHGDIDAPISPTADTTLNEGQYMIH